MKLPLLAATSAAALMLGTGAFAADLYLPTVPEEIPAETSGLSGYVELGGQYVNFYNTEEDEGGDPFGLYGEVGLWYTSDAYKLGIDGSIDFLFDQEDEDNVPQGVRTLGVHGGMTGSGWYAGAFAAVGWVPDEDNEVYTPGYAVGLEGLVDVGDATLFGHVGYADSRSDPDNAEDSGFTGMFGDLGVAMNLTEDFAISLKGGAGYAPENFADSGEDDGLYVLGEIKAAYMLPTEFPLALTASYELGAWMGLEEEDTGVTHTVKVGLSVPFGAESPKDALHVLSTPTAPFRMSAWGEKLD